MARSRRLFGRLVSARAGWVVLLALVANVWASAALESTGVTSTLGHLIRTSLPLGVLYFDEPTSERPFGIGEFHDLRSLSGGIPMARRSPLQWHDLSYIFAAIDDGAGGYDVLSTQDVIERYGRRVAVHVDDGYRMGGRHNGPITLEPGLEADFLISVNLTFGDFGIWA